ncbi:MAG: FHA domain-containing protein, partial [Candidatus Omnitrophica bacterium]|nr:FHA domain-containing protein [Candidatus Omnitrophota bacterium]
MCFHKDSASPKVWHFTDFMSRNAYAEVSTPTSSTILWDPIVSIEFVGREHVYDIEVEGTHNFIGNGIFAHNTFIREPVTSPKLVTSTAGQSLGATFGNLGRSRVRIPTFIQAWFRKFQIGQAERLLNKKGLLFHASRKDNDLQANILTIGIKAYPAINFDPGSSTAVFLGQNTDDSGYRSQGWRGNKAFIEPWYSAIFFDEASSRGRLYVLSEKVKKLSNYNGNQNDREVRVVGREGEVVIPPDYVQGVIANVKDKDREILRMNQAGRFVPLYLIDKSNGRISIVEILMPDKIPSSRVPAIASQIPQPAPEPSPATVPEKTQARSLGAQLQAGLCVTGDTLLPIRDEGGVVKLVPIVSVRAGDWVLSLNEALDRVEPHRINALLDMGVKPVFKLTTALGRSIKTTANHPYLVKHGESNMWVKVSELRVGEAIACPPSNQWRAVPTDTAQLFSKPRPNREVKFNGSAFYDRVHSDTSRSAQKPLCRLPQLTFPLFLISLLRMKNHAKYSTEEKEKQQDRTLPSWKGEEELAGQAHGKNGLGDISDKFCNVFLPLISKFFHSGYDIGIINNNQYNFNYFNLPSAWAEEASQPTILWDPITSIEFIGREQVYDIEVEGTHNFIGNGIFAHNTYVGTARSLQHEAARLGSQWTQVHAEDQLLGIESSDVVSARSLGGMSIGKDGTAFVPEGGEIIFLGNAKPGTALIRINTEQARGGGEVLRLLINSGGQEGAQRLYTSQAFLSENQTVVVGREAQGPEIASVIIDDPAVSRRHLEMRFDGTQLFIKDLGSTNGSILFNKEEAMVFDQEQREAVAGENFVVARGRRYSLEDILKILKALPGENRPSIGVNLFEMLTKQSQELLLDRLEAEDPIAFRLMQRAKFVGSLSRAPVVDKFGIQPQLTKVWTLGGALQVLAHGVSNQKIGLLGD